jgi:hypothetical protein
VTDGEQSANFSISNIGVDELGLLKLVESLAVLDWHFHVCLLDGFTVDLQTGPHNVASLDWANTLWRSCQDNVALLQCHNPADITKLPWNAEKHELGVIGLLHLAVDRQPEVYVLGVGDPRLGNHVTDGKECVESLCDGPREPLFLCLFLYVAASHVNGEHVSCIVL